MSRKDFEGFKNLFQRFLQVKGPSVEWIKIQRPPEDSVRSAVSGCLYDGGEKKLIDEKQTQKKKSAFVST